MNMAPTRGEALATWEAAIAALEGMSTGVVSTDDSGLIPLLTVSNAAFHSIAAAIHKVNDLPGLSLKTWTNLINKKVRDRHALLSPVGAFQGTLTTRGPYGQKCGITTQNCSKIGSKGKKVLPAPCRLSR